MAAKADTSTVAGMVKQVRKDKGDGYANFGGSFVNPDRIPFGCMALDMATNGGLPRGKCSVLYGPNSSSKTNLLLRLIAINQWMRPKEVNAFIDLEHALDPKWATQLGVNMDKLAVFKPTFAEETVDIIEGLLSADDCGIVGCDSLGNLTPQQEIEEGADWNRPGGASVAITKLTRKATVALNLAEMSGRYPTLVLLNQVRTAIGQRYGDPEKMPGGNALLHHATMIVRLHGKNIKDAKISDTMPVRKEVRFKVMKWKTPILSQEGLFEQAMLPHKNLRPGESDDLKIVEERLVDWGLWKKSDTGKGWEILADTYKTQDEFKQRMREDREFSHELRVAIIKKELDDNPLMLAGG